MGQLLTGETEYLKEKAEEYRKGDQTYQHPRRNLLGKNDI
jgi:hypothetical protein